MGTDWGKPPGTPLPLKNLKISKIMIKHSSKFHNTPEQWRTLGFQGKGWDQFG